MQAANSMGKVRKGSAPTWETFRLSSRVVLSLTVLPTLLVVLLASLSPLPDRSFLRVKHGNKNTYIFRIHVEKVQL